VISALFKALGQLTDPPIRRVIFKTFLLSVALSAVLFMAAAWGVTQIQATGIGWLDGTIEVLGGAAAFVIREILWGVTKLVLITVVLNLLVLPIYLVPVLNIFVFYALNGYLLGREYFELAALRRMDDTSARQTRRRHGTRVFIAGIVITFLLSIPFVNWFMPVVAAAFIVHVFEGIRSRGELG
jgi:uncharacterized protein involved in cysteine biosynthesis